jgi:hypothetical protein
MSVRLGIASRLVQIGGIGGGNSTQKKGALAARPSACAGKLPARGVSRPDSKGREGNKTRHPLWYFSFVFKGIESAKNWRPGLDLNQD